MTKKEKTIRLAISGAFLVVVLLTAITIYQAKSNRGKEDQNLAKTEENVTEKNTSEIRIDGKAKDKKDMETKNVSGKAVKDTTPGQTKEETKEAEQNEKKVNDKNKSTTAPTQAEALASLDFSEKTLIEWPVSGSVLMDYSMDKTVHFKTLDVYKYNPALIISAKADEDVKVVANSKVVSITDDDETGKTITMDMGNGYKAVYGQLKDVTVAVDQVVNAGAVIGSINAPTEYYTKEGNNLYFGMSKDDKALDPNLYLP